MDVRLSEPDTENGLATMVFNMVKQNLEADPSKEELLKKIRLNLLLIGSDLELTTTLQFRGKDGFLVHPGKNGTPDITVTADSETILQLSLLKTKMILGFEAVPILWDETGRTILKKMTQGLLKIHFNPMKTPMVLVQFNRVARILSVTS